MANLSSRLRDVQDDAAPWMRIVWASVTGLLTVAMLAVGGILALQYATIIFAVPFAFVLALVMWGLLKALRVEARRVDAPRTTCPRCSRRGPSVRAARAGGRGLPARRTSSTSRTPSDTSTRCRAGARRGRRELNERGLSSR